VRGRTSRPRPRDPSELQAARWYRARGYRVLATNVWEAGYEIDLIARRARTVVFCEVKSKGGVGYGDPLEMVTEEKARRIRIAADGWIQDHPELWGMWWRFDVIAVREGRVEHVPDAF
jgi:putative endonuclease